MRLPHLQAQAAGSNINSQRRKLMKDNRSDHGTGPFVLSVIPAQGGIQHAATAAQNGLDASFRWHDKLSPGIVKAIAFAAACAMVICAPAIAQQNAAPQLQVIADFKTTSGPHGAKVAISPDGLLMAHFGEEFPGALYVKNLSSGEDKLIVKGTNEHPDWSVVGSLAFSPDGNRLIFETSPARKYIGEIYTVKTDGSDLTVLASDQQRVSDTSDVSANALHDISISKPLYSPDGSKVLVEVYISNSMHDEQGDDSGNKHYIGLLSVDGVEQTPKKLIELAEGEAALFWSSDGTAIYYRKGALIYRVDIETKQSTPTTINTNVFNILGRIPGSDAIIVRNLQSGFITVMNLDGTEVSQDLKDFAARIPFQDSDGRYLRSIDRAGPRQLLLTYEAGDHGKPDIPRQHSQLVGFQ
jgi:sugar lactone lactonase YvrE